MREELLNLSAVQLRRRIGTKEISPVELLEACIARIERIDPAVNAVTAVCYERARQEAKVAERAVMRGDALGLLHGLPAGGRGRHAREKHGGTSASRRSVKVLDRPATRAGVPVRRRA